MVHRLERWNRATLAEASRTFRVTGFLVAGLSISPALAGDIGSGQRIAERWCASCHLVSPQQATASADVPSFQAVARTHDLDDRKLRAFLADPHPKMPDMQLGRSETDDLVSYIRSLR